MWGIIKMIHHDVSFFRDVQQAKKTMTSTLSLAPPTSADIVYLAVREHIMTAQLAPGERLVHRQLAKQYGVSNIPVVEALRRLESDGLVTSYPNAGAQVKSWSQDDIRGAYLAREALEGVTCRLFVENASPREKALLADCGHKFDAACEAESEDAARTADIALHLYIAGDYNATARSSALFGLVKNSCLLTATIRSVSSNYPANRFNGGPIGVHDELIEALNSGDPDLAERTGKAHVRNSMEDVMRQLP